LSPIITMSTVIGRIPIPVAKANLHKDIRVKPAT